jgi:hypothetical protein
MPKDKLDDIEWRLSAQLSVFLENLRTRELEPGQRLGFVVLVDERKWELLSVDATKVKSFALEWQHDGSGIFPACQYCAARATKRNRVHGTHVCDECGGSCPEDYERIE